MVNEHDAIIIGAGQAGPPLAIDFANANWKTAIVEREHVGGTCVNEGCIPTKTMVASARVAYLTQRAADYGVHTGPVSIDMLRVRQRKRDIVDSYRAGGERRLKNAGVNLVMGTACFSEASAGSLYKVQVHLNDGGTVHISAPRVFINTGARPDIPSLEGLDQVPYLNSTSIMELDKAPEHLLVLGGGYIGLEFGQMFRRFGSEVTIVQRSSQLLRHEDQDIAEEIAKILKEDGIQVLLDTKAVRVKQDQNNRILLGVETPQGERTLTGSHLLIATGRKPNSENLKLDVPGVETDQSGYIKVNDRLETNIPGIYALGNVNGGPAFTHISYDDYRIVRDNLLLKANAATNSRLVPYTIFIDPQLGRVGLSERQAEALGKKFKVARIPMNYVTRALELDEARGLMKAIVDHENDQILGAAVLGIEGGEIMSAIQLAMMGKLPYTVLKESVFAHPTLAESLNTLFSSLA